ALSSLLPATLAGEQLHNQRGGRRSPPTCHRLPPMAGYRSASSSSAAGAGGAAVFAMRVLLLLTLLPLALAAFAFALQWRGGMRDPTGTVWPADTQRFPGMENSPLGSSSSSTGGRGSYFAVSSASASSAAADCAEILGRSASSHGISLYRGWSFDSDTAITPKVRHALWLRSDLRLEVLVFRAVRCDLVLRNCG
uniref:Uncharacterized protein n=1 Tax=Aegilops tauschii subsp. strangulata TaxID=200361 RepID=A0A453EIK0_AEGTS